MCENSSFWVKKILWSKIRIYQFNRIQPIEPTSVNFALVLAQKPLLLNMRTLDIPFDLILIRFVSYFFSDAIDSKSGNYIRFMRFVGFHLYTGQNLSTFHDGYTFMGLHLLVFVLLRHHCCLHIDCCSGNKRKIVGWNFTHFECKMNPIRRRNIYTLSILESLIE